MFCNNCGKEIDENAVVCPYCGSATDKMAEVTGNTPNPEEAKKTNIQAIVGFVLSLLYWAVAFIPKVGDYASWIMFVAAFVLCIQGLQNCKRKGQGLKGLAIAGIVLCCIDIFWFILAIILVIVGVAMVI